MAMQQTRTDTASYDWSITTLAEGQLGVNIRDGTITIIKSVGGGGGYVTFSSGGAPDQNLWKTITSDSGSAVANIVADILTISGAGILSTSISGDTLTITIAAINVSDLANGIDGEIITWDSAGIPTTVAVGTAGDALISAGPGAEPSFGNLDDGTF